MDTNEEFKNKFNEIQYLCDELFPITSVEDGEKNLYDSIRKFADTLNNSQKSTLLNILKIRNIHTHNEIRLFNISCETIEFMQGIIDGLNRKKYYNMNNQIDVSNENLKTKNLKIMSQKLNKLNKKLWMLNAAQINIIKSEFEGYILDEKKAVGRDEIKNNFFKFLNQFNSVTKRTIVLSALEKRKKQKQNQYIKLLNIAKERAKNELFNYYQDTINEISGFHPFLKKRAKQLYNELIINVQNCVTFDDLENFLEDAEEYFDDIISSED